MEYTEEQQCRIDAINEKLNALTFDGSKGITADMHGDEQCMLRKRNEIAFNARQVPLLIARRAIKREAVGAGRPNLWAI